MHYHLTEVLCNSGVRNPYAFTLKDEFASDSDVTMKCFKRMLGDISKLLEGAYGSTFDMTLIDNFEERWHEAFYIVETDFPAALQTFTPSPEEIVGPPQCSPYERYNHPINNQYPELSAMKKVEHIPYFKFLRDISLLNPIATGATTKTSENHKKQKTFHWRQFLK
ncbi:unnamed protein product [Mytilus coruscus]|uniref:Uncharacterized protein n=1 Tax=Mytilus coruscus TaxID=42192 RepID=A0A6J8A094_MYTCO|nr:unnamed protein product [Mytilus coruscus]